MTALSEPPDESHPRPLPCTIGCTVLAALAIAAAVFLTFAIRDAREAARQSSCRGRLGRLMMALHNYHDVYGSFPPACIADADGKPMHSWRVLILPFLDEDKIYRRYRFDEPWNSPHNVRLAEESANRQFRCPNRDGGDESPHTDYVAIVGPETAFPGSQSTRLDDIRDGQEDTILLAEIHNSGIQWMEPRDLATDRMSFRVNDQAAPSISSPHPIGPGVVFADRITVYRLDASVRPQT